MEKNGKALILFALSIIFFSLNFTPNLTGNITGSLNNFHVFTILGFVFLAGSFVLFLSKRVLDAIVIPTGGGDWDYDEKMYFEDKKRAETAVQNKGKLGKEKYFVISGDIGKSKNEIKEGRSRSIYSFLRRHKINPSQMIIEGKSHDTLENVLYTLKKLKERKKKEGAERTWEIAFVSYPGHLERIEDFEKEAIKKGIIGKKDFRFHKIKTKETPEEREYEGNILRRIRHQGKLLTMGKYKSKK